ncbi:MAG TPA: RagB/SusD family nutrient uptake outer membrane protein [Cyclobacteriaceae bacterium]|nr:RagB/SusD family nutrient uptake outer membrane protein [Cyclobacteriaceae bacterium]
MKHIYKYTLAAGLIASVMSCTNLDEDLQDRYTERFDPNNPGVGIKDNVNKTVPDDGLQGAFTKLRDGSATNGGFFAVQEGGTDEAVITQKGGDWFDGGLYIRMHHHEFSPQTWAINDTWVHAYAGILQCNDIMEKVATLNAGQKAQLRALRAYFHWRLMDVFGNVPIVAKTGTTPPQSTRAQVYDFVVSELIAARADLPATKQEYARWNQAGVNALLARIYLNSSVYTSGAKVEYQKAIDAADAVINSGLYSLSPEYSKVFDPKNVENQEHIFVVPFDEATGEGAVWPMMTLHYPSQLTYKLQSQPWNGFSTLEEFYNSYADGDERKKANFIVGPQYDRTGNQLLDLAYDKADPDGAGLVYTPKINELFPNASRQAGARFGKFAFKIGQKDNADNDMPLLRYGEVLLNKAEAMMRLNGWNNAEAVAIVNQIRARAKATPFTTFAEKDMLAERGRELFVEAHRRTDLIRFNAYHLAWWEKQVDPNAANHILMAIPQEQMVASSSTANPLKQNPGY